MNDAVTWLDLSVAILLVSFIVWGAWIGLIRQLAAFFALVGSYVIAARYLALAMPIAQDFVDNPVLVFLLSFALLFACAALLFTLAGKILHRLVRIALLGWVDRLLGGALGLIKAGLLASLLYMLLTALLSPSSTLLSRSLTTPLLRQGAELLKVLIQDPQLRNTFKEHTPALPLDLMRPENQPPKAESPDKARAARQAQPDNSKAGQPVQAEPDFPAESDRDQHDRDQQVPAASSDPTPEQ